MSNALNLYSDVVKNIAKEINIALSPDEEIRLAKPRPVNPKAYRAVTKSRHISLTKVPRNVPGKVAHFLERGKTVGRIHLLDLSIRDTRK